MCILYSILRQLYSTNYYNQNEFFTNEVNVGGLSMSVLYKECKHDCRVVCHTMVYAVVPFFHNNTGN